MNINVQGDFEMKIKKFLSIILLVVILSFNSFCFAYEEDPDDWDYVWLDEAIQEVQQSQEISILSRYAVVYDRSSGTVLWGKNENTPVPMASTTKIMTAVVMLEQLGIDRLNEEVVVSKESANTIGSRLGLHTGDKITYNDLLYGLMLCSGNDAAVQIAISIAGSVPNFAELMNQKAISLGLTNTHFVTPHGLDRDSHYTTALELAIITDCALKNPKIAQVVSTKEYTVNINGYPKTLSNTNELLGYLNGVNGVKTGYTSKAGRCLVTSVSRDGFDIITVVLGADTRKIRTQDSIKLIEYTYKNFELVNVEQLISNEYENWRDINEKRIRVYKGKKLRPEIYIESGKYTMYPMRKSENIDITSTANVKFEAPVEKNTVVGEITVSKGTELIDTIQIKTKEKIERKGVMYYFFEMMQLLKFAI